MSSLPLSTHTDAQLLAKVAGLRCLHPNRNNEKLLDEAIEELQRRGMYPRDTVEGNPNTVKQMVDCYGEDWHIWKRTLACPHCEADLRDHETGPPYKREIGLSDPFYDCVLDWSCPDCKGTWPRKFNA